MEGLYNKIIKEEATVRYIVLIFLGAGINFTIGYAAILSGMYVMIQSPIQTLNTHLPQTATILVISYIIIGIIYSTSASLAFHPKRIISPLHIQITTAAFVPILVMFVISGIKQNPPIDLTTGSGIALTLFLFSLMFFFVAGIGQTLAVKYLVGLNGSKQDVNSFGLIVNGKLKDVLKVLRDDDTREALNLLKGEDRKTGKHSFVFRTPRFGNQQFFIAVVEDSDDKTKTQLATVSYKQTYYRIIKPRTLGEEQRKKTLESALGRVGLTFSDNKTDSPAQMLAYNYALSITESKLLGLRSLPPYSKAILQV